MKNKRQPLLYLLAAAAILLAGCSRLASATENPSPQPATRTPRPTPAASLTQEPVETEIAGTVTLWHSWDEAEIPILVEIIKDFQTEFPGVHFDVLYIPIEDIRARYETAAQEGGGPSVILGPAAWGPALYDKGLVSDLSGLADQELLTSLNPAALDSVEYQDALIGLPYSIQGVVLYRNASIIPEVPATFDDLVALAQSFTEGEIIGADLERSFFYSGGHLNGIGGRLMDPNGEPAFDDEKGLAWVELLRSFEQAGPTEFLTDNDLELFKQGRVGFMIDGTWNQGVLAEAIGADNLAIDPWPAYEDGYLSGYVQSENIYLTARAGGDHQLSAWEFVKFFLSAQSQSRLVEIDRLPARTGVQVEDPLAAQALSALAGGTMYPVSPLMDFYAAHLDVALRSIFDGSAQPADALHSAADSIRSTITGNQATPAP